MNHELKILPGYYNKIAAGIKNFELRKNDRGFAVGDILILKEWDGEKYTGRPDQIREIEYIFKGGKYGLQDGWCIMALNDVRLKKIESFCQKVKEEIHENFTEYKSVSDARKGYEHILRIIKGGGMR